MDGPISGQESRAAQLLIIRPPCNCNHQFQPLRGRVGDASPCAAGDVGTILIIFISPAPQRQTPRHRKGAWRERGMGAAKAESRKSHCAAALSRRNFILGLKMVLNS